MSWKIKEGDLKKNGPDKIKNGNSQLTVEMFDLSSTDKFPWNSLGWPGQTSAVKSIKIGSG